VKKFKWEKYTISVDILR